MKSTPSVIGLALLVSACGGRVSEAVSVERDTDSMLSCEHLLAEFRINAGRVPELNSERSQQSGNNVGLLLVAPLFMDFSDTEKKEIEALKNRNSRLLVLLEEKSCPAMPHSDLQPATSSEKIE